jgi:hypothetical protein
MSHDHPFYGKDIIRDQEQRHIQRILAKYRNEPVTDELKQKVWDELMMEKHLGMITIPFKLAMRKDPSAKFPSYLEVILDTKV